MGIETKRYRVAQKRHTNDSLLSTDEFLFGITGGAYVLAAQSDHRARTKRTEARPSFEETYPKYPFSELVRLSVAFGDLLDRIMRKPDRGRSSAPSRQSLTGAKR